MQTVFFVFLVTSLIIAIALIVYFIFIYNGLIALKQNIKKSWSNIDVLLKQRHDEIPKLISVCESFAELETGIVERVTRARENYFSAKGIKNKSQASNEVTSALSGLFAIAENYPTMKSDIHFSKLQTRISQLEEALADRREFYNDSTNNYNIRIQQIPDLFVARILNYQPEELFEVEDEDKKDVEIKIKIPKL